MSANEAARTYAAATIVVNLAPRALEIDNGVDRPSLARTKLG